jgi:proton-translocating NADH-quinone oxidoreductase chain N
VNLPVFIWLILFPALAALAAYLAGRILKQSRARYVPCVIAVAALLGTWIAFVLTAQALAQGVAEQYSLGLITLRMDGLGLLLSAVVLVLATLVAVFSGPDLGKETGQEKYYAMLLLITGIIIGMGCATDLFNMWVWFEAMAVTSYLLVAFHRNQPAALEAGFKYLVQNAAGSVLVVTGIALVFASTGSVNLDVIRQAARPSPMMIAAGALFIIGFGVKTALVPMHTWLPDAHSQAPSGISAMLSGVVIEAGLVVLLKALGALTAVSSSWPILLMGFGALNMLVGNLMALRQKQVKRLLAYSSIAQIGYMLVGLGIALYSGQPEGAQGSFFHLVNHGLMKGLAFLSAGVLLYVLHTGIGDHRPLLIDELSGAAKRYPLAALALSLAVLGLGGLPPLAGFMSKWQIFSAGFETHNAWLEWLVIFAALNSVLSLAYYMPLINAMYRLEPSARVEKGVNMPKLMGLPLVILSAAVVALGVWPNLLNWLTLPAARVFLGNFGG